MKNARRDLLAVLFLVIVVTTFFSKEIFTDQTLVTFRLTNVWPWLAEATREDLDQPSVTSDCTFSYFPRRVFATEAIREGRIPFWNPHQFCGTPFLATFQTMVFYPVNIPLYLTEPTTQMDLFLYLHFIIAAVFAYLFARKLGMSEQAAVISSLGFTFCGFMVTRYGQPTFISTASWLPAVLYFGEHLVERPCFRRAGLLGLVLSLSILAGFPQLVLLILYTLVAYVILRVGFRKERSLRWKATVLGLAVLAIGVACLVCAYQLLPTYELSRFSFRKELPYEMVLSSAHHPLVAFKYLIPDILGHPRSIGVLSKSLHMVSGAAEFTQNYVSTTGYVGILPLVLAALALSAPSRRLLPFAALSGITLLVVFGTGLLYVFYLVLPGFSFSRIDRIIVIYMVSMSILAGYGYDLLKTVDSRKRLLYVGLASAMFFAGLAVWFWVSGLDFIHAEAGEKISKDVYVRFASQKISAFLLIGLGSAAMLLLRAWGKLPGKLLFMAATAVLLIDLIPNGLEFKVSQPAGSVVPRSSFIENLSADDGLWRFAKHRVEVIPSNTATLIGLNDAHGYDALNINHYVEVLGLVDSTMIAVSNAALRRRIGPIAHNEDLESEVLDLLNVKYVLGVADGQGRRRQPVALLNPDYLPRVFLVSRARFFETYEEVLAHMRTDRFDPAGEVLLKGTSGGTVSGESPGGAGRAEITDFGPHEISISVDAETECYLVTSEAYYPGWRVYVDGLQAEMLRADYAFRAVKLSPGAHMVRMTYTPTYFRIGLLFSMAGAGLVAVLISSRRGLTALPKTRYLQ